MVGYSNLHFAIEKIRDEAAIDGADGPRVLVVGPENAGKTSLVKLLAAYAIRCGRQPVVVNVDPKEGMLSVPGSLAAATFTSILDVEEGWGSSPTNGPSPVPVKLPLVYHLGLANPEENTPAFKAIITRLALSVTNRLKEDSEAKDAGCLIDTPGIISQGKSGYDLIQHVASEFSGRVPLQTESTAGTDMSSVQSTSSWSSALSACIVTWCAGSTTRKPYTTKTSPSSRSINPAVVLIETKPTFDSFVRLRSENTSSAKPKIPSAPIHSSSTSINLQCTSSRNVRPSSIIILRMND